MDIKYFLIIIIIVIYIVYNLMYIENFEDKTKLIDLYNKTIVRIRTQKKDFNWLEPYITESSYESIGTGFFINLEGYLVTNYHVINNSLKIYIQIPIYGNKTFSCDLISVYPKLDLALLKIKDFKNDKLLDLGVSNTLRRGEEVIAIGYPLGQTKIKMTSGIVSGFQDGDIQTDSAINPGNSGGPLIKDNKVIGINYSGYNDAQNVSYAIPVDYFKKVYKDMLTNKFINFPILACTFNNTNNTIMKQRKLCKEGYYISKVLENGTMDKAGVKKGDVLCAFDGLPIDNFGEVFIKSLDMKFHIMDYLKYKKVGEEIEIVIIRENENKRLTKTIKLLPNTFYKTRYKYPLYDKIEFIIIGGMIIIELNNNHFDLDEVKESSIVIKYDKIDKKTDTRLIITKILKGSILAEFNVFKAPNILKEVNNIPVTNIPNLKEALKKMKKDNGETYMSFLTENDKYFVLEKNDIKKEEIFLSQQLEYKITPYIKNLLGF